MSRNDRRPGGGETRRRALACLAMLLMTACVYNPAPRRWLPTPSKAPNDAYGAWLVMTMSNDSTIDGEFLAYERDTVWLLRRDGKVRAEAVAQLKKSQIMWYDSEIGQTGFVTVAGALSTISNGYFLMFTMPTWIIMGTIMAAQDSRAPRVNPVGAGWNAARIYARYPAGLPPNLPDRLPVKAASAPR